MEKKLFITDFDGTLLRDDRTISSENILTLKTLRQKKIVTVVATGRSVYSFEKALKAIGMTRKKHTLPIDYVIFSTGAGVMKFESGKIVRKLSIKSSEIKEITGYFNHQKIDYMVHKAIPGTRYLLYAAHGGRNPDFQARLTLYKEFASPLKEDRTCGFKAATEVLAIIPGKADMQGIEKIKKTLSRFSVIHATSPLDHESAWIEVFHKDVSKSKAAAWLSGKLGISRENCLSVGNDFNDQDLLAWSGKGFVVENAPDSLKTCFTMVPSNNQCGMTRAAEISGWLQPVD